MTIEAKYEVLMNAMHLINGRIYSIKNEYDKGVKGYSNTDKQTCLYLDELSNMICDTTNRIAESKDCPFDTQIDLLAEQEYIEEIVSKV